MLESLEPSFQGLFYFGESLVITLQGVTAGAHRARDLAQCAAYLAPARGRIVTGAWHLGGIRQAASYFFSFFNFHFLIA